MSIVMIFVVALVVTMAIHVVMVAHEKPVSHSINLRGEAKYRAMQALK